MTRRLLLALGEAHAHGPAWLLLTSLVVLALPLALLLDALSGAARARRIEEALQVTQATCEAGCPPTPLVDAVLRCPSCGLAWKTTRNAYEPCPRCASTGHLSCACGLPLLNPVHEDEP